jgi:hypothetical protein
MVDKKRREAEGPECSLVQYQRGRRENNATVLRAASELA